MILAAFQSGLTPIAIASAVGLFAVALMVLLFVRFLFRIRTPIAYYVKEHVLTITLTQLDQDELQVVRLSGPWNANVPTRRIYQFLRGYRSMHSLGLTPGFRKPPDEGFVPQST